MSRAAVSLPPQSHSVSQNSPMKLPSHTQACPSLVPCAPQLRSQPSPAQLPSQVQEPAAHASTASAETVTSLKAHGGSDKAQRAARASRTDVMFVSLP